MGALWESLGSTKDVRGANFEGNPGLILTISFFTFFDLWKVPRGSLERVQAQRRRTGGSQESRSISFWGPKGVPFGKGTLGPDLDGTSKPRTGSRGSLGRTKVKDLQSNNPWTGSNTPVGRWPGEFTFDLQ